MSETKEEKVESRSDYYSRYYKENKQRILGIRKKRYMNDEVYRARINEQRRHNRKRKRLMKDMGKGTKDVIRDLGKPMKVFNPDKTMSAVVKMYTVGRMADILKIKRTQMYGWLHKGKIPEANYVMVNGWRLYTEHELDLLEDILRKEKISLGRKGYDLRMSDNLENKIKLHFDLLIGGVKPSSFEAV
jgi:hypothetical protein